MCQYCEFKNEKGAKAFIREGKNKVYIRPMDKLNMGNIFITLETEKFKRNINIDFCPFCGRKIHKGYISGVSEKVLKNGTILQTLEFKRINAEDKHE